MAGVSLRTLRFDQGLSPEDLGARVGVSGRTIRRIEDGTNDPTPLVAKKIADYFGLRASELWPQDIPEKEAA